MRFISYIEALVRSPISMMPPHIIYSKSLVARNSSKEPESAPSREDSNYQRKSLRNMVKIIDILRNSRPLGKSRVFLR